MNCGIALNSGSIVCSSVSTQKGTILKTIVVDFLNFLNRRSYRHSLVFFCVGPCIPTLLNGKIGNKGMKTVSSEVTYVNSITKNKLKQHKVPMTGDSFLRGIRKNVELSLSNKSDIYSMVKPGCELNTLLESANSVLGSLTQRDIILICGGSNDFNYDKGESIIDHIMEFIKTNKHTNIVLTNVPI